MLRELANLNLFEIEEMIEKSEGEERDFYVKLYNKVLEIRRKKTLGIGENVES